MDSLVKNPRTGRLIKKNGYLYNKLMKEGVVFGKVVKKRKKFIPVLDKKVSPRISGLSKFKVNRTNTPWAEKKPHTKKERELLYKTCGKNAFLIPTDRKFPICQKLDAKNKTCTYNCNGLKAASRRAGEFKYKNVLKKSKLLTSKLDCYL